MGGPATGKTSLELAHLEALNAKKSDLVDVGEIWKAGRFVCSVSLYKTHVDSWDPSAKMRKPARYFSLRHPVRVLRLAFFPYHGDIIS